MKSLIILTLVLVVVAIVIKVFTERRCNKKEKLPYFKKNYLITKAESSFFRILEQATENKYYIFPQIRISNLLYVKTEKRDYFHFQSKIKYKSVDFVLTDKNYLNPLLAIELDDSTHNHSDRMERDAFIEDAFEDADFPLLRVKYSLSYDVQKIKTSIEDKISGKKEIKE